MKHNTPKQFTRARKGTNEMKEKILVTFVTIGILILILAILFGIMAIFQLSNPQEYTVTHLIIQTELQSETNSDGALSGVKTKYLYFCELDTGATIVFENEDSLMNGKFDSSTILAKLRRYEESGETFTIRTKGFRVPFLSMYQNIIEVS